MPAMETGVDLTPVLYVKGEADDRGKEETLGRVSLGRTWQDLGPALQWHCRKAQP